MKDNSGYELAGSSVKGLTKSEIKMATSDGGVLSDVQGLLPTFIQAVDRIQFLAVVAPRTLASRDTTHAVHNMTDFFFFKIHRKVFAVAS